MVNCNFETGCAAKYYPKFVNKTFLKCLFADPHDLSVGSITKLFLKSNILLNILMRLDMIQKHLKCKMSLIAYLTLILSLEDYKIVIDD